MPPSPPPPSSPPEEDGGWLQASGRAGEREARQTAQPPALLPTAAEVDPVYSHSRLCTTPQGPTLPISPHISPHLPIYRAAGADPLDHHRGSRCRRAPEHTGSAASRVCTCRAVNRRHLAHSWRRPRLVVLLSRGGSLLLPDTGAKGRPLRVARRRLVGRGLRLPATRSLQSAWTQAAFSTRSSVQSRRRRSRTTAQCAARCAARSGAVPIRCQT